MAATAHTNKPAAQIVNPDSKPRRQRRKIFNPDAERYEDVDVWEWLSLPAEFRIRGPAIVEHPQTTVYVSPSQTALLDKSGNLSITSTP